MKKLIALIPMSAKPYTAGHDGLVRLAAKECDEVNVFVSLSDRDIIKGKNMQLAWENIIAKTLPENVYLSFGGVPVRNVYDFIDTDQELTNNVYVIYSDPVDLKNNFGKVSKYFPNLIEEKRILLRSVERTETVNVSGTLVREFIKNNDFESFSRSIPEAVNAKKYWEILRRY